MKRYNPKEIEPKWQKIWEDEKIYQVKEGPNKPKKYVLEYFPYPSGAAMHVGHVRNYTIGDVVSRHARMRQYNVLHPMGWDAFGLPAENYAIKSGIDPAEAIKINTKKFKQQLMQMGFGYDWSREIDSTDPNYYKWTQWFFTLLFKKGLAYQKESLQWWCPNDKTVLANEQVEAGKCWRCGSEVEKKSLKQWFFKITDYADRLLGDLDDLDWSEAIKTMQRNWIGRSVGAEINFEIDGSKKHLNVFTTRPDTLHGATFMVLAPEHPLVEDITTPEHKARVNLYVKNSLTKSDIERQETEHDKTGVFTGAYTVNPTNNKKIPIWVADYVLMGYGTGAIMAVPAHDERDFEFAKKFKLPIVPVIRPLSSRSESIDCFVGEGLMINSGKYNGKSSSETREKITAELTDKKLGSEKVNYKIRDWLISRQRYWGSPIPIIHCPKDGAVAVPEDQLPVLLPKLKDFEPSGDGRSPLARISEFVNTTCPKCGGPAERETDTMDGFACSSWYFLRFADPHNDQKPFDRSKAEYWLPVDDYIGGAEHAVMHLLYARFWTKVMFDEGLINFTEPFTTLRNHGMILAPDGQKMSKSKNNTIEPDGLIETGYGADAVRIMELFIGPWNQAANWSMEGLGGAYRFLNRVWEIVRVYQDSAKADPLSENNKEYDDRPIWLAAHTAIARVSEDLSVMGFNTAIARLMEYVNELYKLRVNHWMFADSGKDAWKFAIENLLKLLAPIAPHVTEELWHELGHKESVHLSDWPVHDGQYLIKDTVIVVVQVNGKLRGQLELPLNSSEEEVVMAATQHDKIKPYIEGNKSIKVIYVPNRLVNLVTS